MALLITGVRQAGKTYVIEAFAKKHAALCNVLKNPRYNIKKAYVFYNGNLETEERKVYLPMYMLMCVKPEKLPDTMIYKPDLTGITDA